MNSNKKQLPCVMPWKALFMDENKGKIQALPCCFSWISKSYGSVEGSSLEELWNSEEACYIRFLLASGRSEEICDPHCPFLISGQYGEAELRVLDGPEEFIENQRLNNKEIRERRLRLNSLPMLLKVIPTLQCNLSCRMCFQEDYRFLEPNALFWEELNGLLPVIHEITFQGGEVTLDENFRKFLGSETLKSNRHVHINLITNGTILDEDLISSLATVKVNHITVSLNAASRDTYQKITGKDLYRRVLTNVRRLVKLTGEHHQCEGGQIILSFVVMRSNVHELPDFIKLARALGTGIRLIKINGNRHNENIFNSPKGRRALQERLVQAEQIAKGEALGQVKLMQDVLDSYGEGRDYDRIFRY